MSESGEVHPLSADTRILHVLAETTGPVVEVAKLAVLGHLRAGFKVAVAAHRSLLGTFGVPEDLADNFREIELAARRRFTLADPNTAFTLHKYYQHVDIVHAHGLHAATLAGLAFTGLPARLHPKVVATIESFDAAGVIEKTGAEIVGRTATALLGTTEPVVDYFGGKVPIVERAELVHPDIDVDLTVRTPRAQVRKELGVEEGTWMVASPIALRDHTALATILDAADQINTKRPGRSVVTVLTGTGKDRSTIESAFADRGVIVAPSGDLVDVAAAADVVIASETMTGLSHEDLMQLSKPAVFIGNQRRAGIWGAAAKAVAADDTDALLSEINHLLDDPAGRGSQAVAAKKRVIDVNNGAAISATLLDLYAEVAESSDS
ncbi:group 1 glycosyl transferase [Brevibacterium sp. UCMA 11752]|uniref:group 1 glycosyl transferase n=1 Tax=Brevibacterium sp. UCMA 11752 TaxID=2745946 RepID=UPI001F3E64BC|nr:group 1 glycosyl transferase [Brevibacterium sp. UCMA 11752]MCF2587809.1 group 1 glycosyl transferase [Brevibacterium sp. UCMA 11752]